ncbi:hypothetical protein C9J03_22735 [Photobacterium gaetbulicola]|uniref:Uncharacterized protein n=1 Tax=Photobacterium gaetbulicola Gung47 TaxID=658445 RepID=A0A0C5WP87_9GAMM|nr:hypothetical protein [Photobacterium gaetbulicola]AJR06874.1 hypothetical protein H744_2c0112 [Photobacterium gaetbulicola Gung47]PSU02841.1 hypothetical protein C9J03_22735 [Photobacterium gaetbulicola]
MALHAIIDHKDYQSLSAPAQSLLWTIARQYNGYNNGWLKGTLEILKPWGWKKDRLKACLKELKDKDWLRVTRVPRYPKDPYRYALSWEEINSDKDGMDEGAKAYPKRSLK